MTNNAITNLQIYLRQLSYTDPNLLPVPIDGIYELETQNAVIAFQAKHNLETTGIVNKATWDAIYAEYLKSIIKYSPPLAVNFFPRTPIDQSLHIGDVGFIVSVLQYMLRELSRDYGDTLNIEISGIYDESTESAVKEFQKSNSLYTNGRVDQETWNRITEHYNTLTDEYIQ